MNAKSLRKSMGLLASLLTMGAQGAVLNFDNLPSSTPTDPSYVPSWYGPDSQGDWAWSDTASNPWRVVGGSSVSSPNYVVNTLGAAYGRDPREWWVHMNVAGGHGPAFKVIGASFQGITSSAVTVEGWLNGVLVDRKVLSLVPGSFQWYDLNFREVQQLKFYADSPGKTWAMDDFHYAPVPEASTILAGALLAFPIGFQVLRRSRRTT